MADIEILTILGAMKQSLADALDREYDGAHLCQVLIAPGDLMAWDFEDTAWVRLGSANPTQDFPTPDLTARSCASTLAYEVEVGVLRKAPIFDDRGRAPSVEEQEKAVITQMRDMEAMREAIRTAPVDMKILGDYLPAGPEGGLFGGIWSVTVGMDL